MSRSNEGIRIGIIGVGRVAHDRHIPGILANGGKIVALADRMAGHAASVAKGIDGATGYDDYRELLARDDFEAVTICTPTYTHAEIAIAALEAGKHLYLDKPPAMSEAEMQRIADAAQKSGTILLTGSNGIYYNEIQATKRRIEEGDLGEIYYVECLKRFRRSLPRGWLKERRFGGGIGLQTCSHRIDQVLYLLDSPSVVSVTARTYNKFAAFPPKSEYVPLEVEKGYATEVEVADVEDTLMAFIQFDTGCTFLLRDAYACNLPDEWTCNLWGTKAGAVIHPTYTRPDLPPLTICSETSDGLLTEMRPTIPPGPKGTSGQMVQVYHQFFAGIRRGHMPDASPERAIMLMRILDAIYKSADNGGKQVLISQ